MSVYMLVAKPYTTALFDAATVSIQESRPTKTDGHRPSFVTGVWPLVQSVYRIHDWHQLIWISTHAYTVLGKSLCILHGVSACFSRLAPACASVVV